MCNLSPGTSQRQLDGNEWIETKPDNDQEPDRHDFEEDEIDEHRDNDK